MLCLLGRFFIRISNLFSTAMKNLFFFLFLFLLFVSCKQSTSVDYVGALIEKAEKGDVESQFQLGVKYQNGDGVNKDYQKSIRWYRLASKNGNVHAQYKLAMLLEEGEGEASEGDLSEAKKWYTMAAGQGHTKAQYRLGEMYFYGIGGEQNYKEAEKLIRNAAEKGNQEAQDFYSQHQQELIIGHEINKISLKYAVVSQRAYFYDAPHGQAVRAFLVAGEVIETKTESDGFVYTEFINQNGVKTSGWLDLKDLRQAGEQMNSGQPLYENIIRSFVAAEDNRDFNRLYSFVSQNMVRYWDISYPSYDDLLKMYQYAWDEISYSRNNINGIQRVNDYVYDLYTEYSYRNKSNQLIMKNSVVRFVFDDEGKIKEVFGL